MFNIGIEELMIILVVALLVLGPKRLPEIATGLGKAIRDFKKATRDLQTQLDADETIAKPLQEVRAALRYEPAAAAASAAAALPPPENAVAATAPLIGTAPATAPVAVTAAPEAPKA
jgi:TatA/E family protein of Tat protein translocase